MMKALVVVEMQNGLITGARGTEEAQKIVSAVTKRISAAATEGWEIVFTMDTHHADYLSTQEGKNLPVVHCVKGTDGFALAPEVEALSAGCRRFEKNTFGSVQLASYLREKQAEEVELIGLCTDICVISNAMLIKAFLPETKVSVKADCCAGVTPQSHDNALSAMKMCQISVL